MDKQQDLTTKELASLAGVNQSRIRQELLAGNLKGYKRGQMWFVHYEAAKTWLQKRGIKISRETE